MGICEHVFIAIMRARCAQIYKARIEILRTWCNWKAYTTVQYAPDHEGEHSRPQNGWNTGELWVDRAVRCCGEYDNLTRAVVVYGWKQG